MPKPLFTMPPVKRASGPVVPKARAKPEPAAEPPDETLPIVDQVRARFDEIQVRYSQGYSLQEIGETIGLTGMQIRAAISGDAGMHERWQLVREHLAHGLIEEAVVMARKAGKSGDYKGAADISMKLAAKLAPKSYGDKTQLEVSGPDGGPIESTVTMSPSDAYKAMLGGG